MKVDSCTYRSEDFTCSECNWQGKGADLAYGEYSEAHNIVDLECPKCWHLIAFYQD